MGHGRSPAGSALKTFLLVLGGVTALGAITIAALGAALAAALAGLGSFHLHFGSSRKHLKPIPIDKSACPYVKAMHVAAIDFELANPVVFGGSDVGDAKQQQQFFNDLMDPKRWPAVKARVDQNIVLLDVTIRLASPRLPKRIQDQLAITRRSLHLGRIELHRAKSWLDLSTAASDLNRRGQTAFGNASDLIGMACGVHVGV